MHNYKLSCIKVTVPLILTSKTNESRSYQAGMREDNVVGTLERFKVPERWAVGRPNKTWKKCVIRDEEITGIEQRRIEEPPTM